MSKKLIVKKDDPELETSIHLNDLKIIQTLINKHKINLLKNICSKFKIDYGDAKKKCY